MRLWFRSKLRAGWQAACTLGRLPRGPGLHGARETLNMARNFLITGGLERDNHTEETLCTRYYEVC